MAAHPVQASNVDREMMAPVSKDSLVQSESSTLLTWVRDYEKNNLEATRDCPLHKPTRGVSTMRC